MRLTRPHRPSRPAALAGTAAILAAAALAVSITTAVTQTPAPAANAFYSQPGAVPELTVNIACAPGTDHGTATVHIAPHSSGAFWQATLSDAPSAGAAAMHRFYEVGKSQTGWAAPYPITGRGVVQLASPQPWVATETSEVPYNCHS